MTIENYIANMMIHVLLKMTLDFEGNTLQETIETSLI